MRTVNPQLMGAAGFGEEIDECAGPLFPGDAPHHLKAREGLRTAGCDGEHTLPRAVKDV